MSVNFTTLAVAIVGVLGTLIAPVLTQRLVVRARQQELDVQHQRELEARVEDRQRTALQDRLNAYVALNAAFRVYRRTMRNHVFEGTDKTLSELEQARQVFDVRPRKDS